MRDTEGAWEELTVPRPNSDTPEPIYLSLDQPLSKRLPRIISKHLFSALKSTHPDSIAILSPSTGVISSNWKVLATVTFNPNTRQCDITWDEETANEEHIDHNKVMAAHTEAKAAARASRG